MSIEIELRGKVVRGVKLYELVKFKMLSMRELPRQYITDSPYTYSNRKGKEEYIFVSPVGRCGLYLEFGELYSEKEMEERIETIKLAVKRLQKINAELKKENEGWDGSLHTIII